MYSIDECKEILSNISVNDIIVGEHFRIRLSQREFDISGKLLEYITQPNTKITRAKGYNRFMLKFFCKPLGRKVVIIIAINEAKQVILITMYDFLRR
ncbi:hypothetical protein [Methanosphaera cuniculi]|uniref:hypothetical protein n=1 Tax=Methanosphaera cuniculi TaxID=1077256 RepID=UPI0026EC38C3|nr:hypothetical protein [Methanosphaera cuniculi]